MSRPSPHHQRSPIRPLPALLRLVALPLAVPFCLLALAGCSERTCTKSRQCPDDGLCVSGVCTGYTCESDDQCSDAQVCAPIGGTKVCVLPCDPPEENAEDEADSSCPGAQVCRSPSDAPEHERYCL